MGKAKQFELQTPGLKEGRIAFNCGEIFRTMSEAGVLNRGADCDLNVGMFDLAPVSNNVPLVWSLPHFYQVEANDSTQHPRNNVIGLVTPTGPRYRTIVTVEPESGRVLQSMIKEQVSVRLYQNERNYFFTRHKPVIIPLYRTFATKNATQAERELLGGFQSTFQGLHAGFIACVVLGGVSLIAALFFGMLLYQQNSLQTVNEKRKRIQEELASALPPEGQGEQDVMVASQEFQ